MPPLGRLWRTVRWLKPAQVVGRARLLLPHTEPARRPAPPVRAAGGPAWVMPARRQASLLAPRRQSFLNVAHDLREVGWDDPRLPLLWRYNQHYFDDLCARDADQRADWHKALITEWITANPPVQGTGWAPYPTSLRIANWIKWFWSGHQPSAEWLDSLAHQVRWLQRRLEWHLLGNHLFVNAKALVLAGLFFEGPEADRWRRLGERILLRELPEQFLDDGAQFERSPMYHALGLEDLLDLLNAQSHAGSEGAPATPLQGQLRLRADKALGWMRCMALPEGRLASFNDCADGIAPPAEELERYAAALGVQAAPNLEPALLLQPSGFARLTAGPAQLLADVGPIGPDYLPGHAHADTLSFELAVHGRLLLANRGTSEYGTGPRRLLERGTAAHNTVEIDETNSSEVWSGFRVGRRAHPFDVRCDATGLEAAHDGYRHLHGHPVHRRRWQLTSDSLTVDDQVDCRESAGLDRRAMARFHLAPGLTAVPASDRRWRIDSAAGPLAELSVEMGTVGLEHWEHAAGFGRLEPAVTLRVQLDAHGRARTCWSWNPPCTSFS